MWLEEANLPPKSANLTKNVAIALAFFHISALFCHYAAHLVDCILHKLVAMVVSGQIHASCPAPSDLSYIWKKTAAPNQQKHRGNKHEWGCSKVPFVELYFCHPGPSNQCVEDETTGDWCSTPYWGVFFFTLCHIFYYILAICKDVCLNFFRYCVIVALYTWLEINARYR